MQFLSKGLLHGLRSYGWPWEARERRSYTEYETWFSWGHALPLMACACTTSSLARPMGTCCLRSCLEILLRRSNEVLQMLMLRRPIQACFLGQRWLNKCIRNMFLLPLNMINISGSCSEGLVNVSCRFSSSSNREVLLLSATLPLSHSCLRPRHVRSYGRRYSARGHWFRTQREMVSKGFPPCCFWG